MLIEAVYEEVIVGQSVAIVVESIAHFGSRTLRAALPATCLAEPLTVAGNTVGAATGARGRGSEVQRVVEAIKEAIAIVVHPIATFGRWDQS